MYRKEKDEVLALLATDPEKGLNDEKVRIGSEKYGKNEFRKKKKKSTLLKFLEEFKDPLIIVLLSAAVISLIADAGEWIESAIIFIVVIINAALGVYQENKAEKALEALEKLGSPLCKVIRNGIAVIIDTVDLVNGDIIVIEAGDYIPADARIIECSNLQVDESALTGESVAIMKQSEVIEEKDIPLGDQKNMLFSSTFVTAGRGKAAVTGIGMNTEIGKIAGMLLDTEQETTPLQHKLGQVSKIIGLICLVICTVVFILEYVQSQSALESFKSAVALAVAAVPEGLATVVTIVLSIGVANMAKVNAVVKKLPAVETLGSTSVVCSDKTGTLTQNKMTVREIRMTTRKKIDDNLTIDEQKMLACFSLCCDASIEVTDGIEKRIGDPTETALIEANNKYGISPAGWQRIGEIPFDSSRKMMSVFITNGKEIIQITKGAPDIVIARSLNGNDEVLTVNEAMASDALRVLAVGYRKWDEMPPLIPGKTNLEHDLILLGLVGMNDPARPEVKQAIETAKRAGIRTIMITGDHIATAKAIASQLGITENNLKAISSEELNKLTDEELYEHIEDYAVYARVSPEDKVRIVDAWQKKGKIVAMTGDGVNDSPALKKADIGCAMGITGTDVSKEAADMILMDDNYSTIITAVKEGRGIYANIRRCIRYLLSSNLGEVLTILVAAVISLSFQELPVPLLPIHLLWVNLITDALPAFGIGMEKADERLMNNPPRPKKEGFFAHKMFLNICLEGIIVGSLALASFLIGMKESEDVGRTMAFLTLSGTQLFHAYNVKNDGTIFSREAFKNRFMNWAFIIGFILQITVIYVPGLNSVVFRLSSLSAPHFLIAVALAFSVVIIIETVKAIKTRKKKNPDLVYKRR